MGPVKICLLGPLELTVEGNLCPPVRAKKGRLLLGYLIVRNGQFVPRNQIAAMLWPDSYEEVARFNLRQLLSSVRKDLAGLGFRLKSQGTEEVAFDLADCWVDLFEFKRKVELNPAESIPLYRGPLMEGFKADWLDGERAQLDVLYRRGLERLADEAEPAQRLSCSSRCYRWSEKGVSIRLRRRRRRASWQGALCAVE